MGINRRRTPPHEGPPAAPGHADRTAGGLGGAAPASLDLYGQSSTEDNPHLGEIDSKRLFLRLVIFLTFRKLGGDFG